MALQPPIPLSYLDGSGHESAVTQSNPLPVSSGGPMYQADSGVLVPFDSLEQNFTYDGSGNLSTIWVTYNGHTYTQTLTYTSGNLSKISKLVQS